MHTLTNNAPNSLQKPKKTLNGWRLDSGHESSHTRKEKIAPSRKKVWVRRQKQAILFGFIGFVLFQLCLAILVENEQSIRDPEYHQLEQTLKARIAETPVKELILFLGSSRVTNGVHARNVGEHPEWDKYLVFNFGIPTAGPTLQRITLQRLLDHGISPKMVYLEVLVPEFNQGSSKLMDQKMLDAARLNYSEFQIANYPSNSRYKIWGDWLVGRGLPLSRHQRELHDWVNLDEEKPAPPSDPHDAFGTRMKDRPEFTPDQLKGLALRQYSDFLHSFEFAPGPYAQLCEMIELCQARGIQVVLFLMPEGSDFRDGGGPEQKQKRNDFVQKMRAKLALPVIDARDWCDDNEFYDGHHLNTKGALHFTSLFSWRTGPGREQR